MSVRLMVSLTMLVLLFATDARADWPASPLTNLPIATGPAGQWASALVSDSRGGCVVVWQDGSTPGAPVRAQRVDGAGHPCWGSNGVLLGMPAWDYARPRAAADGAGGAIVTWVDQRFDVGGDIYAQRVDSSGTPRWGAGGAPVCTNPGFGQYADVVSDGAGGAIVAWMDERTPGTVTTYAQKLDAEGAPLWIPNGVPFAATANGWYSPASIAADDSGGVIAAWNAVSTDEFFAHAVVQRIDAAGQPRWSANGIAVSDSGMQVDPAVVSDGVGGAIVVFADSRGGNGQTTSTYGQRVASDGSRAWGMNGRLLGTPAGWTHDDGWHAAVTDGSGGAIFTWMDVATFAIHAQRVDRLGALLWPLEGVLVRSPVTTDRYPIDITPDGSGGVLIPWFDYRNGGDADVFVQHLDAAGSPLWTADGVLVSSAFANQMLPLAVTDGAGGALLTWGDYRSGTNTDVYAQNVTRAGTLGGSTLGVSGDAGSERLELRLSGANPVRGPVEVQYRLQSDAPATLSVFDVSGRLVERHTLEAAGTSAHRVRIHDAGVTRAPGLFLVRLEQADREITTRFVWLR